LIRGRLGFELTVMWNEKFNERMDEFMNERMRELDDE